MDAATEAARETARAITNAALDIFIDNGLADELVVQAPPGIKKYYASDLALDAAVCAFGARFNIDWALRILTSKDKREKNAARKDAIHFNGCKTRLNGEYCFYCERKPRLMSVNAYELEYRDSGGAKLFVRGVCMCHKPTCLGCMYRVERATNFPDAPRPAPLELRAPPSAPRKRRRRVVAPAKTKGRAVENSDDVEPPIKRSRTDALPNVARQLMYAVSDAHVHHPASLAVSTINIYETVTNNYGPHSHAVQPTPNATEQLATIGTISWISYDHMHSPQFRF